MSSVCSSSQARTARPSRGKRYARSKYVCGHCDQELSKTQFYKHKKLFFHRKRRLWQYDQLSDPRDSTREDFDFGFSSDHDFDFSDGSRSPSPEIGLNMDDGKVTAHFKYAYIGHSSADSVNLNIILYYRC